MCLKQKRMQQPPELKRSKSQGTRKLQKAQSVASVEEIAGGGVITHFLFPFFYVLFLPSCQLSLCFIDNFKVKRRIMFFFYVLNQIKFCSLCLYFEHFGFLTRKSV